MKLYFVAIALFLFSVTSAWSQVHYKEKDGKYAFFHKRQQLTDFIFDDVAELKSSHFKVMRNGKHGFVNSAGTIALKCIYDKLEMDYFGEITASKGAFKGIFNIDGHAIIPCEYTKFEKRNATDYFVYRNDKVGVYSNGKIIIPCEYDRLMNNTGKGFVAKKDGLTGVLAEDGAEIIPLKYEAIDYFEDGEGLVKYNGTWEIIDEQGNISSVKGKVIFRNPEKPSSYRACLDQELSEADFKSCVDRKMWKRIYMNINYPQEAMKKGVQGTVVVKFVISPEGEASDYELVKGIGGGCDEEALRVIRSVNSWIPAEVAGEKVWSYYVLRIKYKLGE